MATMKKTGPITARDSKGWEWRTSGEGGVEMTEDSASMRRQQANDIERETRRKLNRTQAMDASDKMGNPARYAAGGVVRGSGLARSKKCKMV